jgi:ParB family chromosome partitioning protein
MAEKRRGLGRGLGALIPSAPIEEAPEPVEAEPVPQRDDAASRTAEAPRKQGGRPVDLFFERVTEDDVAEQPRSYSSALRSGINRNVLEAQTKRVGKTSQRKAGGTRSSAQDSGGSKVEAPTAASAEEPVDGSLGGQTDELSTAPAGSGSPALAAVTSPPSDPAPKVPVEAADADQQDAEGDAHSGVEQADAGKEPVSRETRPDAKAPTVEKVRSGSSTDGAQGSGGLVEVPGATFADLPLDSIHPNRKQPRVEFNEDELAELVHSIREIGVLQPVVVRPSQEDGEHTYELVMGERRWRASREAGMTSIPAIIRSTLDDDLLRDALLENLHRSALNPLEEAAAYQQLLDDFGCSHDELAGRLGRSRPQISNTLRLMKLPPLVQRRVAAGVLSAGHARALLGLGDAAEMEKLAQRIVAEGLSVRSTEEIVALSGGLRRATKPSVPGTGARHERLDYLATSLSDRLDTNVKITLGAKKGRVSIEFASVDDLNRIIGVLSPTAE